MTEVSPALPAMTAALPATASHCALPPDRFLWGVLDTKGLPAGRASVTGLGFLFENVLPVPIENVHAVYQPIAGDRPRDGEPGAEPGAAAGRVLACGMMRDDLQAAIAVDREAELLTLSPTALPDFLSDVGIEPQSMNLLRAEFEPKTVIRLKRRLLLHVAAVIALIAGLVIAGLERRAASLQQQIEQARSARMALIAQALASTQPSAANTQSPQPPDLRFLAELRTLRQTRQPSSASQSPNSALTDATGSLSDLLEAWPATLHVLTDSISVTPTAMTLRGQAPASGDVQMLADALSALPGWQFQQPQVTSSPPYGVNATLQWKREIPPVKEGAPTS